MNQPQPYVEKHGETPSAYVIFEENGDSHDNLERWPHSVFQTKVVADMACAVLNAQAKKEWETIKRTVGIGVYCHEFDVQAVPFGEPIALASGDTLVITP